MNGWNAGPMANFFARFVDINVEWSWFGWFGLGGKNKMAGNPEILKQVQDTVWADPRWKATKAADGTQTTHCNQGSLAIANGMGCHEFDPPADGEPYTADQLFNFFQRATSNFLEKDMTDVQQLANAGSLVFACLPSWILQEAHGHIVSITPGIEVMSDSLQIHVPLCLNISTIELSARSVGINFAFPMHRVTPRFFVWKGSL